MRGGIRPEVLRRDSYITGVFVQHRVLGHIGSRLTFFRSIFVLRLQQFVYQCIKRKICQFEVFAKVTVNITVVLDVTTCSLVDSYQRFE
jgi:hypothetical protein